MEEIIENWENLALRYRKKAQSSDGYAYENLVASASTLEMCAEQLKLFLHSQTVGQGD